MLIPVLIEPMANRGFCAKAGEPLSLSANGATRDEALANLRQLMAGQLNSGNELVAVAWPAVENPWLAMAGMHDPNDPLVQEWKEDMAAYRKEVEDDPNYP